jgi:hypothetical protein
MKTMRFFIAYTGLNAIWMKRWKQAMVHCGVSLQENKVHYKKHS